MFGSNFSTSLRNGIFELPLMYPGCFLTVKVKKICEERNSIDRNGNHTSAFMYGKTKITRATKVPHNMHSQKISVLLFGSIFCMGCLIWQQGRCVGCFSRRILRSALSWSFSRISSMRSTGLRPFSSVMVLEAPLIRSSLIARVFGKFSAPLTARWRGVLPTVSYALTLLPQDCK